MRGDLVAGVLALAVLIGLGAFVRSLPQPLSTAAQSCSGALWPWLCERLQLGAPVKRTSAAPALSVEPRAEDLAGALPPAELPPPAPRSRGLDPLWPGAPPAPPDPPPPAQDLAPAAEEPAAPRPPAPRPAAEFVSAGELAARRRAPSAGVAAAALLRGLDLHQAAARRLSRPLAPESPQERARRMEAWQRHLDQVEDLNAQIRRRAGYGA